MPALDTPAHREQAKLNFYSAERRAGVDHITAYERSEAFGRDLDRIYSLVEARQ